VVVESKAMNKMDWVYVPVTRKLCAKLLYISLSDFRTEKQNASIMIASIIQAHNFLSPDPVFLLLPR
jgi:hypothetical protein